jgi:hypothetical protein
VVALVRLAHLKLRAKETDAAALQQAEKYIERVS